MADAIYLQVKLDRVVSAGVHGDFFAADYGDRSKISIGSRVNHNAIDTAISKRLTAQIKRRRVQIEQVWETKLASLCFGGIALAFRSRPSYSAICKGEMSNDSFPSITFCLLSLDRLQRFRAGGCAMVHIQSPQHSNQANGSAGSVELKLISGRLCKMDLSSSGSKPRPPEAIGRTHRAQVGKIPNRIFADCRLPIRRQRAGAEREQ